MKTRLAAIAAVTALLVGGLFATPASAANSTITTAVNDAGSNAPWNPTGEVYGASAEDTAVVTPDVSSPAGGNLTYSFFLNGTCTGIPTTQTVNLNPDGTVPNSSATGILDAGSYSFDAIYNGDGTNHPSLVSACEPFTVLQA